MPVIRYDWAIEAIDEYIRVVLVFYAMFPLEQKKIFNVYISAGYEFNNTAHMR